MSLSTYSIFYYGFDVTTNNRYIDFDEGAGELTATLPVGSFTMTQMAIEVARALNDVGLNTYTCTVNRTTRIFTITASVATDFLGATGSNASQSVFPTIGLASSDSLAATSVVGATAAGSTYSPQLTLQDHVSTSNNKRALSGVVTKSASGSSVSVQSFGEETFLRLNFKYITNRFQPPDSKLRNDSNALANVRAFLDHCITKAPVEFMENVTDRDTFEKLILESTPQSSDGIGYELRELLDRNLPGYFESGILTFKTITE